MKLPHEPALTQNFTGPTPDEFALFLLDAGTGFLLFATSDPTGADALFVVDITGTALGNYQVFSPTGSPGATLTVTPVPEPASLLLLGTGLAGLAARRLWM